jgi:deoxyribonuclease V
LPCLLALLREHALAPRLIVIDGFVFLSGGAESQTHDSDRQPNETTADADHALRPGLGKHLYDALDGRIPVIGVAKTAFAGMPADCAALRGDSARPLFVTAVGVASAPARAWIRQMHGAHRIPTLLKRVDRLCREAAAAHVDVQESDTR